MTDIKPAREDDVEQYPSMLDDLNRRVESLSGRVQALEFQAQAQPLLEYNPMSPLSIASTGGLTEDGLSRMANDIGVKLPTGCEDVNYVVYNGMALMTGMLQDLRTILSALERLRVWVEENGGTVTRLRVIDALQDSLRADITLWIEHLRKEYHS